MSTPSPSTPADKSRKLQALKNSLEFKWFACHATVLFGTLLTLVSSVILSRAPTFANFFYRLSFAAAIGSFGIIVYQRFGLKVPALPKLLAEDNFQYLLVSVMWLLTRRRVSALIPFGIYSLFHVLTYMRSYLLPALGYPENDPRIKQLEKFVETRNESLTLLAASVELVLLVQLILAAVMFAKGSWIQLIGFLFFFRWRYANSLYTRQAVKTWEIRIDDLLGHPSLPPVIKNYWIKAKKIISNVFSTQPKTPAAAYQQSHPTSSGSRAN